MKEVSKKIIICLLIIIFFINGGFIYIIPAFSITNEEEQEVEEDLNSQLKASDLNIAGLTKTNKITNWKVGDSLIAKAKAANWKLDYNGESVSFGDTSKISLKKINRVYVVKNLNLKTDDNFLTSGNLIVNDDTVTEGKNIFYIIILPQKISTLDDSDSLMKKLYFRCVYVYVDVEPTGISFKAYNQSDGTIKLVATVTPSNVTDSSVTWSVEDETMATIEKTGNNTAILKPKKSGTIYFTAKTSNNITKTGQITVNCDIEITKIIINGEKSIYVGEDTQLITSITPSNATDQNITWTSQNEKIATVDKNGKVKGISEGKTTITASASNGINSVFEIEILKKEEIEKIKITSSNEKNKIKVGEKLKLNIETEPSGMEISEVKWKSENSKIALVDDTGTITGIAAGKTNIVASLDNGITDSFAITIEDTTPEIINISEIKITSKNEQNKIKIGETLELVANILPKNATETEITWSSTNKEIAVVDADGKVIGKKEGQVTIKATAGNGVSGSITIEVKKNDEPQQPEEIQVENISIEMEKKSITINEKIEAKAVISPTNATNPNITWTSLNSDIIEIVSSKNNIAIIKGKQEGKAIIKAMADNGVSTTVTIEVKKESGQEQDNIPVESVSVKVEKKSININEEIDIEAVITPTNATNQNVTFMSLDNDVIEIISDKDGIATIKGKSEGTGTILVMTDNMKISSVKINVLNNDKIEDIPVNNVKIEMEKNNIMIGDKIILNAIITPENASNKDISWIIDDEDLVEINELDDGNIELKGIKEGKVVITAITNNMKIAKCSILINDNKIDVEKIEIVGKNTVEKNETIKLTANIIPENATNKQITWISSDENIATVDDNGKVTGVERGMVTIIAIGENMKVAKFTVQVTDSESDIDERDIDERDIDERDIDESDNDESDNDDWDKIDWDVDDSYHDNSYIDDYDSTLSDYDLAYAGSKMGSIIAFTNFIISGLVLIFKFRTF